MHSKTIKIPTRVRRIIARATTAFVLIGATYWVASYGGEDQGRAAGQQLGSGVKATFGLTEYKRAAKPTKTKWGPGVYKDRIVVKFTEGSKVRLKGNQLTHDTARLSNVDVKRLHRSGFSADDAEAELSVLRSSIEARTSRPVRRLFSLPEDVLDVQRDEAEQAGGLELGDLNLYYEVSVPEGRAQELVDALNESDLVEIAYPAPIPVPAATDLTPTTSNLVGNQGYLNAAPKGIDARYSWTRPGGTGANVRIIVIEYSWNTQHEDLGAGGTNGPVVSLRHNCATDINGNTTTDHGTAAIGEMVAANNAYGVTGISYGASYGVSGVTTSGPAPCTGGSVADAISAAVNNTSVGDIIVLEQGLFGPVTCPQLGDPAPPCGWKTPPSNNPPTPGVCNNDKYGMLPMEYAPAEFNAISIASFLGRIVIEPAANGEQNLDDPIYNNLFNLSNRDSGAIMVGGGDSSSHNPLCYTDYGSRVTSQGWGQNVYTLGYGDPTNRGIGLEVNGPDINQWYTYVFGGTSSASPIVAAAAANVQGFLKASGQTVFTYAQMRSWLALTGTPQPTPITRNIGSLPNLRALTPSEPSANGFVAGVQQTSTMTSVFSVGADKTIYQRSKTGSNAWQLSAVPGSSGLFPTGAPIATGFQGTNQLDIFSVGTDGKLRYNKSTSGGAWNASMIQIGAAGAAPSGAHLATGIRNSNQLNVFFVNNSGTLVSYSVSGTGSAWTGPTAIATNFAPAGAPVATGRQGTNQIDVFAIGNDGALKAAWAIDGYGWNAPVALSPTSVARPGAGVATGRQGTDQLDALFVGNSGIVRAAWVIGQGVWNQPINLHSSAIAAPGALLSAANHGTSNNTLDVFVNSTANAVNYLRVVGTGAWTGPTAITNTSGQTITSASASGAKRSTNRLDLFAIGTNGISVSTSTSAGAYSTFTKLPPL